jgi:hypothetical protein
MALFDKQVEKPAQFAFAWLCQEKAKKNARRRACATLNA